MKKKTLIVVLTGCMVLSPVSVYAADATEEAAAETTEAAGEATDSESAEGLGDDIYSFSSTCSVWGIRTCKIVK